MAKNMEEKMKLLIRSADGCPVTDIAVRTAVKFGIECVIICDTAHSIVREGARTITVDKGADSADLPSCKPCFGR